MLQSLHVKNLALIEEAEVEFKPGLNILTGETGAGKSILIGSVNLALGAKADTDLIRRGAEYALVELCFDAEDERVREKLSEQGILCEEGLITITRRLQPGRSICRINGETVTAKQVKELADILLDVHGQHEHQSLLGKKKHLEILDAYAGGDVPELAKEAAAGYKRCAGLRGELSEKELDEAARKRELELLAFELEEIEGARLSEGEDEELENRYRKMANSRRIGEALGAVCMCTDGEEGAASRIGRAVRELGSVVSYDRDLEGLSEQLGQVEDLLNDFNRELAGRMEDLEFDGSEFMQVEERLNLVNRLKEKYGRTVSEIEEYKNKIGEKIEELNDYENHRLKLRAKLEQEEKGLREACEKLSDLRKKAAAVLADTLKKALEDLNFLSVDFAVRMGQKEIGADGFDDVEFAVSLNPGEECRPLGAVASGGELSRIMLAIKTVLADKDYVDTLIFDEIDAGISGRTAWKVSEKLGKLAAAHQVICITHLPQIAAMADSHFVIEKKTDGSSTVTGIRRLSEQGSEEELARLLGAEQLSDAALYNAREMRGQAAKIKQN